MPDIDCTRPYCANAHITPCQTGAFSNRVSFVNDCFCRRLGSRFSPRSEQSAATSGPKHRCCNVHNELAYYDAAQGPLAQPPVPSPGGLPLHPQSCSDESYEQWSHAALGCSDQRNGSPERQTLCKITESFLASATRALPLPDRLAIARAQSFKREALLTRDRITTAASYNRVRASVSPHLDILPLRSTSPD